MGAEGGINATQHTSAGTTRMGGKGIEKHYGRRQETVLMGINGIADNDWGKWVDL
jgi:hypothetical protein